MRKIIEDKRKGFRSAIRREQLEQFFARKRKELLESEWEGTAVSSKEEIFLQCFPSGIEDMCKEDLSPALLQKMVEQPHLWLQNCKPLLNISQWMGLIQLLLRMMERIESQQVRLSLLQSSRRLICGNTARLLQQNKTMKKQMLMQLIDLFLQARAQITKLHQGYIILLQHTLKDILSLKMQDNELLLIKAFSYCNMLIIDGTVREKNVVDELLVKEKWNTSRMIAFIQEHGLAQKNRQISWLIKIVLITLINLIEFDSRNSFYQLFWHAKFKAFMQQILHFPSDLDPSFFSLYLKLFYNLMITNEIFCHFINSVIDTNALHLKLQEEESLALLKDIQELIAEKC